MIGRRGDGRKRWAPLRSSIPAFPGEVFGVLRRAQDERVFGFAGSGLGRSDVGTSLLVFPGRGGILRPAQDERGCSSLPCLTFSGRGSRRRGNDGVSSLLVFSWRGSRRRGNYGVRHCWSCPGGGVLRQAQDERTAAASIDGNFSWRGSRLRGNDGVHPLAGLAPSRGNPSTGSG